MSSDLDAELTEHLYRATSAPHGIALVANDPERAITRLSKVKSALADPDLARVRIFRSPLAPDELWLTTAPNLTPQGRAQGLSNENL